MGGALSSAASSTTDQVDDYHGTRIADPYRPLERVSLVGNRLAAVYLHHAHHRLAIFERAS